MSLEEINNKELTDACILVQKTWKTEDKFRNFSKAFLKRLNKKYFNNQLPNAEIQVIPISSFSIASFSHGIARYENDSHHTISIRVDLLGEKKQRIKSILLHEYIHLWERSLIRKVTLKPPQQLLILIEMAFKNDTKGLHIFKHVHSDTFIAKLFLISKQSKIPMVLGGKIDKYLEGN